MTDCPVRCCRGLVRASIELVTAGWRTGFTLSCGPARRGPYTTAFDRFNLWAKRSVRLNVFGQRAQRLPRSLQLIDSAVVRAHPNADGGEREARITPSAALAADWARRSMWSSIRWPVDPPPHHARPSLGQDGGPDPARCAVARHGGCGPRPRQPGPGRAVAHLEEFDAGDMRRGPHLVIHAPAAATSAFAAVAVAASATAPARGNGWRGAGRDHQREGADGQPAGAAFEG